MKQFISVLLLMLLIFSFSSCNENSKVLTEDEIRQIVRDEISKNSVKNDTADDEIRQIVREELENTQKTNDIFGTPEDDYTKYFNFCLVNGKYCAMSVKRDIEIPEVLVVPNLYNGIEVAYTGAELISGLPVKTIIFEPGVECSYNLCGDGNNCPSLENIVFLSENPLDCIVGKLRMTKAMPLQLNEDQYNGGKCKIFVPDVSLEKYNSTWYAYNYSDISYPLSELDDNIAKYIK